MRDNGYLTETAYEKAVKSPLNLVQGGVESSDAPYFVDLVNDRLQDQFANIDFQSSSYRVYTTLDMKLQRDAVAAVQLGIKEVDEQLAKRKRKYPQAQVALVALDPHTGEVKALVGGRSYGQSQLNRAMARRQPGSIFKPFVYATALRTALEGSVSPPLTPMTRVADEPTTFWYDGKPYEPNNFRQEFHGTVTLRQALARSMNIPTVKFAEMAGYEEVAVLAREVGLKNVRGTPAVALGAYEVRPLEIAAAYTVFSNGGEYVQHSLIREIRTKEGTQIAETVPERQQVLDPRISYIVVNLMEEVVRSGTGAGIRSRGFGLPAAGKTGTSHDAWFAGFTSKLLCVVWVGFDDNQELPLEGSKAALPIWTEFMKRAHQYREYRGVTPFRPPDGIVTVEIDPMTGAQATPRCATTKTEVFLVGTEPHELCPLHGGGRTLIADWDTSDEEVRAPGETGPVRVGADRRTAPRQGHVEAAKPAETREPDRKRGFLDRFLGIFKK
jgi:penicillin-binding protein 1B